MKYRLVPVVIIFTIFVSTAAYVYAAQTIISGGGSPTVSFSHNTHHNVTKNILIIGTVTAVNTTSITITPRNDHSAMTNHIHQGESGASIPTLPISRSITIPITSKTNIIPKGDITVGSLVRISGAHLFSGMNYAKEVHILSGIVKKQ